MFSFTIVKLIKIKIFNFFFNMKAKARFVILRQKGEITLIFEPHKK